MAEDRQKDYWYSYGYPKRFRGESIANNIHDDVQMGVMSGSAYDTSQLGPYNSHYGPQNSNTFNNQGNRGRLFGGLQTGGTAHLGDAYNSSTVNNVHIHGNYNGPSILSSQAPSDLPSTSTEYTTEALLIKNIESVQTALKEMYLRRFKKINPFSLPFTFDIENTWVSLALREDAKDVHQTTARTTWLQRDDYSDKGSQVTEDHAELLTSAFEKEKMLIIEGKPATGKTSLMRRLAYEWAKGEQKLSRYDLVLYAEFREVRDQTHDRIIELIIKYITVYKSFMKGKAFEELVLLLRNSDFCEEKQILLLLDGYDESSLSKKCRELNEYITATTLKSPLYFNIALTTRPGYLGKHRGKEGRYIFADVLGFTTEEQKEKYILNHFSNQPENKKQENISAVRRLLKTNKNVNKLAETPLFLTFICLVHERIVDGTVLELYCNTIWWLIDRHQTDNPDRDVPNLFEFYQGSSDKFRTIQNNYLRFTQLLNLSKMAFNNLEKDIFHESDYAQYNLKEVIQQVGLLRKDEFYNKSFHLTTTFSFPHRTIQEFLAALYCFCSHEQFDCGFKSDLYTAGYGVTEYEKFLLRIALSDKIPINEETRTHYFDVIEYLIIHESCDALQTSSGVNVQLLNTLLSKCNNMRSLNMFDCIFETNSQLSVRNNASLNKVLWFNCTIHRGTVLGIAHLKAFDRLVFNRCKIDMETWKSIIGEIRKSSVKCLELSFMGDYFNNEYVNQLQNCNNILITMTITHYSIKSNDHLLFNGINLHSLGLRNCSFKANSQLSFSNCPFLKTVELRSCYIHCNTALGIAQLKEVETLEIHNCKFDMEAWQPIVEEINNSSVKYLDITPDMSKCLNFLQENNRIEEISVRDHQIFDGAFKENFEHYEDDIVTPLIELARSMQNLRRINFKLVERKGKLKDSNKELIEKAGRERDPDFTVW